MLTDIDNEGVICCVRAFLTSVETNICLCKSQLRPAILLGRHQNHINIAFVQTISRLILSKQQRNFLEFFLHNTD